MWLFEQFQSLTLIQLAAFAVLIILVLYSLMNRQLDLVGKPPRLDTLNGILFGFGLGIGLFMAYLFVWIVGGMTLLSWL